MGSAAQFGTPRVVKPLDPVMIRDAVRHKLVVTIEDGLREGGIGQAIRDQVACSNEVPVVVMGFPTLHIPHGSIDEITGYVFP